MGGARGNGRLRKARGLLDNYMTDVRMSKHTCAIRHIQFSKTLRFPSPMPSQVTESALVALATRAGVAGISELASVHSRGV